MRTFNIKPHLATVILRHNQEVLCCTNPFMLIKAGIQVGQCFNKPSPKVAEYIRTFSRESKLNMVRCVSDIPQSQVNYFGVQGNAPFADVDIYARDFMTWFFLEYNRIELNREDRAWAFKRYDLPQRMWRKKVERYYTALMDEDISDIQETCLKQALLDIGWWWQNEPHWITI